MQIIKTNLNWYSKQTSGTNDEWMVNGSLRSDNGVHPIP